MSNANIYSDAFYKERENTVRQQIGKQLDDMEKSDDISDKKPLTEIQTEVLRLMSKFDDVSKVSTELGVTERTIYFHISQIRKKNWKIQTIIGKKGVRV